MSKVKELNRIAEKYMDKIKNKIDQMNEKQQQELIYFLLNLYDLMLYMNIIDFNIWRVYFETVVLISKKKAYTYYFSILLGNMDKFCKRFSHEQQTQFKDQIVFKDEELPLIITQKLIYQLLGNISNCPRTETNQKSYVFTLFSLSNILFRISKINGISLNGYNRLQFFKEQQSYALEVLNNLEEIDLVMYLFSAFGQSGALSLQMQEEFKNKFLSQFDSIKNDLFIQAKIIDVWTKMGNGSQQIYDIIETNSQSLINQNSDLTFIFKWLLIAPQTNIQVSQDVIQNLFNAIQNHSCQRIENFQLEYFFNVLIFYQLKMPEIIPEQFYNSLLYEKMILHLKNVHQISPQEGKQMFIQGTKILNDLKVEFDESSNGSIRHKDSNINGVVVNEKYSNSQRQEQICLKSLVYYLKLLNIEDDFVIVSNKKILLYELDLLVYSKKLQKLVAVEICGLNYKNTDGTLFGKKKLKNIIIEAIGIPIKYLNITEENLYQDILVLKGTRKASKIQIGDQILKLIEESFQFLYPKNQLQKKIFNTQIDINEEILQEDPHILCNN